MPIRITYMLLFCTILCNVYSCAQQRTSPSSPTEHQLDENKSEIGNATTDPNSVLQDSLVDVHNERSSLESITTISTTKGKNKNGKRAGKDKALSEVVEISENALNSEEYHIIQPQRIERVYEQTESEKFGFSGNTIEQNDQSISIEFLMEEELLPPMRSVHVRLKISNHEPHAMWYLLPAVGQSRLEKSGKFEVSEYNEFFAFVGRTYLGYMPNDSIGRFTEISFDGDNQHGFKAFYVPSGSSLTVRNYAISCWEQITDIELWGVKDLFVNGNEPLESWLPNPIIADKDLVIYCEKGEDCTWKNMEWNTEQFSAKKLSFVEASEIQKHLIQLVSTSE